MMIRRFGIIILFAIVWAYGALAQEYRRLDSLISLSVSVDDTVLPRIYHDISWESRDIDPMLGIRYGLMALEQSEIHDNYYYEVLSRNALAMNERNIGHYAEAITNYRHGLAVAAKKRYHELEALAYSNIGNTYIYLGRIDSAYRFELEALRRADSIGSNIIRSRVYLNLGLICKSQRIYSKAIEYLEKSFFLRRDSVADYQECLAPIGEMANIYMEQQDYESALNIINMYLDGGQSGVPRRQMSKIWQWLSLIYYKMGKLDSACVIARQSLHYANSIGNVTLIEDCYKLLDSIYIAQGDYKSAALCCRNFIDVSDTVFNVALADQLSKIRYSSQYRQNKNSIERSKRDRLHRYHVIGFAVVLLLLIIRGIQRIIATGREAGVINVAMQQKRASVLGSMEYAHTIQNAVLPDTSVFGTSFIDRFVMYQPREIVSGDFYWRYADSRYEMLAVADCTGHGVPGAMLTMLGAAALQDIARQGVRDSGQVLDLLREKVKFMLRLNEFTPMQDGMDISLIIVDRRLKVLDFAGAFNSLMYVRDGELQQLKATRAPIGCYVNELPFRSQCIDMELGDVYYLLTDGYTSQFGSDGNDSGKYPAKRFRRMLLDIHTLPMAEQKEILTREFMEWKGTEDQVDDVTIVGLAY